MSMHSSDRGGSRILTVGKATLRRMFKVALRNGDVWPAFQPIICLRSGHLVSFEVLARWRDPIDGDLTPAMFVPRLEEAGLLDSLLDEMLSKACAAAMEWPGQFRLAFNVSSSQLVGRNLAQRFVDASHKTGFPLDRLEVEITETTLTTDPERTLIELRELDALGVSVAIDDFGAGYSSLSRLEAFPFKKLKIDRQFVSELDQCRSKRRFAAAMIGLGQSLGMTVVAEGVETKAEEAILRELGCHYVQGWLYGRPASADQTAPMVMEREGATGDDFALVRDASPFQQVHQLTSLYNQAPVGICYLDMDLCHIRVNERFADLHDLTVEQLEGKYIGDIMDGEALDTAKHILRRCLKRSEPVHYLWTFSGRNIFLHASRVTDVAGELIGASIVSIDVDDQVNSRQTLSRVMKSRKEICDKSSNATQAV